MTERQDEGRYQRDRVRPGVVAFAILLSLLIHMAALLEFEPPIKPPGPESPSTGEANPRLSVEIAPPQPRSAPAPAPSPPEPARTARAEPPPKAPPPAPVRRPAPPRPTPPVRTPPVTPESPPVIAVVPPTPPPVAIPEPAPAPPASPAPSPPAETDLSSYIASRRRARGESEAPATPSTTPGTLSQAEDIARRDRIVAANLGSLVPPTFGEPRNSGGIFQITHLGYDEAEFTFFGWNRDIRRRASQRIEVRQGPNPDIRIAIVRRMILIIREHEQEDFVWESKRLGRNITLSARTADTAGLEAFMMEEFFVNNSLR